MAPSENMCVTFLSCYLCSETITITNLPFNIFQIEDRYASNKEAELQREEEDEAATAAAIALARASLQDTDTRKDLRRRKHRDSDDEDIDMDCMCTYFSGCFSCL